MPSKQHAARPGRQKALEDAQVMQVKITAEIRAGIEDEQKRLQAQNPGVEISMASAIRALLLSAIASRKGS